MSEASQTGAPTAHTVTIALDTREQMPGYCARPTDPPVGAVLIAVDIFGPRAFYEGLAQRLAASGYLCLLPDYFFRQGALAQWTLPAAFARRERLDEHRTLRDLSHALDWLRQETGTTGRLGTLGFCMGGTLVLDLAAARDDLATVCYYAFPAADADATQSRAPAPLTLVDRISGPIIGFWGDRDENVGIPNVHRLVDELTRRGVPIDHVLYPGLAHGFLADADFRPDHPAYAAAVNSWERTLAFFREQLASDRA